MGYRLVKKKKTSKRFKDDQAKNILEEIEVDVATDTGPSRKKIKGRGFSMEH